MVVVDVVEIVWVVVVFVGFGFEVFDLVFVVCCVGGCCGVGCIGVVLGEGYEFYFV